MSSSERKRRYKGDAKFRQSILDANKRWRLRNNSPERKQLDQLAAKICRVRDSIAARMRHAERLERTLFALLREREVVRARLTGLRPGGRPGGVPHLEIAA